MMAIAASLTSNELVRARRKSNAREFNQIVVNHDHENNYLPPKMFSLPCTHVQGSDIIGCVIVIVSTEIANH